MGRVSGSALSHVCILCLCRAHARVSSVWPCRCPEQEGFVGGMPLSALGRRQEAKPLKAGGWRLIAVQVMFYAQWSPASLHFSRLFTHLADR